MRRRSLEVFPLSIRVACGLALFASLAGCGATSMKARIADGERRSERAGELIDEAEIAMRKLETARARALLDEAQALLGDPNVALYPGGERMRVRLTEARADLELAQEDRQKRDAERSALGEKSVLERVRVRLRTAVEGLGKDALSSEQVIECRNVAIELRAEMKKASVLEREEPQYLSELRGELEKREARIALADRALEFLAGPGALFEEGSKLQERGTGAPNSSLEELTQKKSLLTAAKEKFAECARSSASVLSGNPALASFPLGSSARAPTPKALGAQCKAQESKTNKLLTSVTRQEAKLKKSNRKKPGRSSSKTTPSG